jgi:ribosome recycling factor
MTDDILLDAEERMTKSVEAFERELVHIRTGRASPSLLDSIKVDYYGSETPLNQVASISIPEPRSITIQPWEKKMLAPIEKAILKSDLGITPANDGNFIRLNIPPLTEERRRDLVKMVKKITEDSRVAIRNIRRDANEQLKKAEKASDISEDQNKRALVEVQKLTDNYIEQIDEIFQDKEKEIMEGN